MMTLVSFNSFENHNFPALLHPNITYFSLPFSVHNTLQFMYFNYLAALLLFLVHYLNTRKQAYHVSRKLWYDNIQNIKSVYLS